MIYTFLSGIREDISYSLVNMVGISRKLFWIVLMCIEFSPVYVWLKGLRLPDKVSNILKIIEDSKVHKNKSLTFKIKVFCPLKWFVMLVTYFG